MIPPPTGLEPAKDSSKPAFEPAAPVVGYQKPSAPNEPEKKEAADPELEPVASALPWAKAMVKDAVMYPWRADGWAIVIPGAVMAVLLGVGSFAPILGLFTIIGAIGYFAAFYFRVVETTISGRDSPPDWPEISNLSDDVFRPGFQIVGTHLVSHLPYFACLFLIHDKQDVAVLKPFLILFASVYQPMACIAIVMHGSFIAAMPHKVVPAIFRGGSSYLFAVLFLVGTEITIHQLTDLAAPLNFLFEVMVVALFSFCSLIIQARITGLVGRRLRERLGWG